MACEGQIWFMVCEVERLGNLIMFPTKGTKLR